MAISSVSIRRPVSVTMLIVTLIMLGILGLKSMPIELMPELNVPVITVQTVWTGATPSEVDKLITKQIEDVMENIDGIKEMSSTSYNGLSVVIVEFDYGIDIDKKLQTIQTEVSNIIEILPTDAKTPLVNKIKAGGDGTVMSLTISGNDPIKTKSYAENVLKPRLQQISGVGEVSVNGGGTKIVSIQLDPDRLETFNLNIDDVSRIIKDSNSNIPSGSIYQGQKKYSLKVDSEIKTLDDIKNIIITHKNGGVVYLSDIANIGITTKRSTSHSRMNGKEAVGINIGKASDGNAIEIGNNTYKIIDELKKIMPKDIKVDISYDSTPDILNSVNNVKNSALIGLLLATLVLFGFLRNVRATIIIALAIPISVIGAFFFLNSLGVTLNVISLMGLSLGVGMLVDNGVVVLDNIYRHMTELKKPKLESARDGAAEMLVPIIASTATTVAVFLPIIVRPGLAKEIFFGLSWSVTFALLASLLVAMTFVPMISNKVLKETKEVHQDGKILNWLKIKYRRVLKTILENKKKFLLGVVTFSILVIFAGIKTVGGEFMSSSDDGTYAIKGETPTGMTVERINELSKMLEKEVIDDQYSEQVETMVNSEGFVFNIKLAPRNKRDKSVFEIVDYMRGKISRIPDVKISVVSGQSSSPKGAGSGGISVDLSSSNKSLLNKFTMELEEKMKKIDGLEDIKSSLGGGNPQAKIIVNREKAKIYGVSPAYINKIISYQVFGAIPITLKTDLEEVDVELSLPNEYKESLEKVLESKIKTSSGKMIMLSDIVDVKVEEGVSEIVKKNKINKLTVSGSLESGQNIKEMQEKIEKAIEDMKVPSSIHIEFGGDNKMMADMMKQLMTAFAIAIFLIYAILASQFESFVLPLIILGTVPLSVVGVYIGLMITGVDFSVMVMIGVIMLAGIVVNNAIVLIDYTKLLMARGFNRREALLEAGRTRLRPILMTSMTTMLGMVPLALGIGQGSEMYQGMAIGVIFGLLLSTLLTLLVIPVLFEGVENSLDKFKKKILKK